MRSLLIVGLGVWGLVAVSPIYSAGAQTAQGGTVYNMGMNLPGINYANNMALYADIMNAVSGNYGPWDASTGAAPLDSTGAPTVPAQNFFPAVYPSGAYSASWTGTGTISCSGSCSMGPVTVHNGISTATLTITQQAPANPGDTPTNSLSA